MVGRNIKVVELLEEIRDFIRQTSSCTLRQALLNPVRSKVIIVTKFSYPRVRRENTKVALAKVDDIFGRNTLRNSTPRENPTSEN